MLWVRALVYGIPVLLITLAVAAFVSTSRTALDRGNEITFGVAGEPTTLNPIQEADAAASAVYSFIFESLLKYDEDLNITTQLAERYTLSQVTTFFMESDEKVAEAVAALDGMEELWSGWGLNEIRADGDELKLALEQPGLEISKVLLGVLPDGSAQALQSVRVDLPDGGARDVVEKIRPELAFAIERVWFDYDVAFELVVRGAGAADVEKQLREALAAAGIEGGVVTLLDESRFLAEPVVDFFLRDDVRWHDGVRFTAEDVRFTYEAIMDERTGSPRKADFDLIESIEIFDPHHVRVRYRKPYSPALNSWMISLIPAHILEGKPQSEWPEIFNRKPVGNGPFIFDYWETNEGLRLVRNPDYYLGQPWVEAMNFRVLPDPIAIRLAFETRQIDYWNVDPWAVSAFLDDPRFTVFRYPANQYNYVGWNLRRPVFQDLRVRRAFAHAVDIPQMIEFIIYGNGVQSTGIFPPHFWFANNSIEPIEHDPDRARELLDEAGWVPGPDGIRVKDGKRLEFTLLTNHPNEVRKDIATLVQDNLRDIGVDVKVEIYEWAVFLTRFVNKGEFDAVVLGWATPPDYDAFQIWHSSQRQPEQLNFVGYNNPAVDEMLDAIRQEYDPDEIKRLASEIQRVIYDDQPYLFLYVPDSTSVIWKDSFRICRPDGEGGWIDTPVEVTKAGWSFYIEWFYRPEFADQLPPDRIVRP